MIDFTLLNTTTPQQVAEALAPVAYRGHPVVEGWPLEVKDGSTWKFELSGGNDYKVYVLDAGWFKTTYRFLNRYNVDSVNEAARVILEKLGATIMT